MFSSGITLLNKLFQRRTKDYRIVFSPDKTEGYSLVLDGLGGEVPALLPAIQRHEVHVELLQLIVIINFIRFMPRHINNVSHKTLNIATQHVMDQTILGLSPNKEAILGERFL